MLIVTSPVIMGNLHIALVSWIEEEHPELVKDRNKLVGACLVAASNIAQDITFRLNFDEIDGEKFETHIPHYWADRSGLVGHETTEGLATIIMALAEGDNHEDHTPALTQILDDFYEATGLPKED